MKNSISASSGKLSRTVAGLIFYPRKVTDAHHLSVWAWVEAGKPDNVYIFDNVDTLKACGIPICDGAPIRGMYRRIPPLKPRPAQITIVQHLLKDLVQAETKTEDKGIVVAEVKEHHKMSY